MSSFKIKETQPMHHGVPKTLSLPPPPTPSSHTSAEQFSSTNKCNTYSTGKPTTKNSCSQRIM